MLSPFSWLQHLPFRKALASFFFWFLGCCLTAENAENAENAKELSTFNL